MERDQVQDMLAASEARTETKFAELRGDLRAIDAKLSHLPNTWTMVITMISVGVGVAGILLAALAFGSGMFGQGFSASAIAKDAASQALAAAKH